MGKDRLLKRGDLIQLEKGMKVYATIPEKFIYSNRTTDEKKRTDVKIGEILSCKTCEEVFDTSIFEGEYRVVATAEDGGGTGMGKYDYYPNGHHVFCEKKDNSNIFVDFYQTGAFTAMIKPEEIKPLE